MANLEIKKYVKTECGLTKFYKLRKNKTIFGKLRLMFFLILAFLRDLNK